MSQSLFWGCSAPQQHDDSRNLEVLQTHKVIGAVAIMYCVEFFAHKFPGADNAWDTLHTYIRISAGELLAASVITKIEASFGLTAGPHLAQAGAWLVMSTSTEHCSNIRTSLIEDTMVVAGLWTAVYFLWSFCFF